MEDIGVRTNPPVPYEMKTKKAMDKGLPIFLLSNIQSFGLYSNKNKITEIECVLNHNKIDVACLIETWLNETSKDFVQFDNYNSFHLIRGNTNRSSGGVSILINNEMPANKLDINVPNHIECLWLTLRPKWLPRSISNIIVVGIYYPGSSSSYAPNQEDITSHVIENIHKLYKRYSRPLFVIMGDFNDLDVEPICDACNLKQTVNIPTRKNAMLDLILTNTSNDLYRSPITLPSIGGSDHLSVLYKPTLKSCKATKKTITVRKFHKSTILEFGHWLTRFSWLHLFQISDVNLKIAYFANIMWAMIDKYFPLVKIVVSDDDKEWINSKIKNLIYERQKAHLSGDFDKRDHLAKRVRDEIKLAKVKYKKC